jgi:hypothetical protein
VISLASLASPSPAAAAAGGPARGYFQVQNERPGHYWARQFNLDGRNVTMGLVATNVAAYGMQMISPGFTRFCMRVRCTVSTLDGCCCVALSILHASLLVMMYGQCFDRALTVCWLLQVGSAVADGEHRLLLTV